MFKIKQINEDFIVREKIKLSLNENGQYQYFLLQKNGLTTQEAIFLVSEKLRIPRKYFKYAGNKDKHALTEQTISISSNMDIGKMEGKNFSLQYVGKGNEPINLGSNEGNDFEIVVRNIDNDFEFPEKIGFIPNYFDTQRFSSDNLSIGYALLQRDFGKAIMLLADSSSDAAIIRDSITKNPNDFIGALRKADKKIMMMYIHSVQSLVFNEILADCIKLKTNVYKSVLHPFGEFIFPVEITTKAVLPLPGFGTETIKDEDINELMKARLTEHNIDMRNFVFKEIPELSSEGALRHAFVKIKSLKISKFTDDELNSGKKKCTLKFYLQKGSYGTIVVKSMFG